jgi:hypothetical protein
MTCLQYRAATGEKCALELSKRKQTTHAVGILPFMNIQQRKCNGFFEIHHKNPGSSWPPLLHHLSDRQ